MHGLYLVWLVQERGFTPALVATVLAAGDLCVFALEVPTGWVADRLGHRRSLIIGSLVQVCGMAALWFAATTPALLVATFLVALGDAFRSGADQALLYRSCVALGREADFQVIESRTASVSLLALVALLLGGGAAAATVGYAVAWIAEIALCATGAVLAFLMVEPPAAPPIERGGPTLARPSRIDWRRVARLIAPGALADGMVALAAFLAQTAPGVEVAGVTALVAGITLAEAAGAWTAARVWRSGGRLQLLLLVCGAAIVAASQIVPAGAAAAAVALAFLPGLIHPLRALALQRMVGDGARARIASLASACDMACSTLGLLAAGALRARGR